VVTHGESTVATTCGDAGQGGPGEDLLSSGSRVRILPGAPPIAPGQAPSRGPGEHRHDASPRLACPLQADRFAAGLRAPSFRSGRCQRRGVVGAVELRAGDCSHGTVPPEPGG